MTASEDKASPPSHVVIVGGGIIGCSIAYYLTHPAQGLEVHIPRIWWSNALTSPCSIPQVTIIEEVGIACHASGKASGFLPGYWNESFSEYSYELHTQLAKTFGADTIGYRTVEDPVTARVSHGGKARVMDEYAVWMEGRVSGLTEPASSSTIAQVHPRLLTKALFDACTAKGVKLANHRATDVVLDDSKAPSHPPRITGVELADGTVIQGDAIVFSMGPWTTHFLAEHIPGCKIPSDSVIGQRVHSLLLKPETTNGIQINTPGLLLKYREMGTKPFMPEMYPRPDGTVYVCGEIDEMRLPKSARDIEPDAENVGTLRSFVSGLPPPLANAEQVAEQACFLPSSNSGDGLPLIGAVPEVRGAFVAAGHGCWGILDAPMTGWLMSKLVLGRDVMIAGLKLHNYAPRPSRFEHSSEGEPPVQYEPGYW